MTSASISYSIQFQGFEREVDSASVFIFSMAESTEDSNPKSSGKWVSENNTNEEDEDNQEEEESDEDESEETVASVTVETSASGGEA